MKTAFSFYFSKFTGTIHSKLKQMWKNKFSENEFEWQSMYDIYILVLVVFVLSFNTE